MKRTLKCRRLVPWVPADRKSGTRSQPRRRMKMKLNRYLNSTAQLSFEEHVHRIIHQGR